jgi:hypothetical protein
MLCFLRSTLLAVHVRADRTQDLLAPTFICAAVTSLQGEPRNRVPSCRLSIGDSNWTENSAHARSGSNNPGHVKREKRCQQQVLLISDIAKGSDPGWAASLPLSFPLSPIGTVIAIRMGGDLDPWSAERAATPATPQLLRHLRCIELGPHSTRHSFENRHTNADCADCRLGLEGSLID